MYKTAKRIFLSLALLFFTGCQTTPPTIYSGSPIYGMNEIDQLKQDKTTVQDVRNVMGEPSGFGKARLKPDSELVDVWFYQYLVMKGSQVNVNIVLIFIDENEIYQGHLAFISDSVAEGMIVGK